MKATIKDSDDITCRLEKSELEAISQEAKSFFSNCLRAVLENAENYFFVNHSSDPIFNHLSPVNDVQIQLPQHRGDPYLVNLRKEAYERLERDKELSLRYVGGAKLFIMVI